MRIVAQVRLNPAEMVWALVHEEMSARLARGERPNTKARRRIMRAASRRVLRAVHENMRDNGTNPGGPQLVGIEFAGAGD